jgi:hypothetical protein
VAAVLETANPAALELQIRAVVVAEKQVRLLEQEQVVTEAQA